MSKPINIATATFTAEEAGSFLPIAAQTAIKGKAQVEEGRAKGAAALALMIAGFASDEMSSRVWSFDIHGGGDDVHTHVTCTGTNEFGNDDLEWKRNGQGAVSKVARSAYKAALQHTYFNMPQPVAAVWTMASKAIIAARAIREEGMSASIENGKLKLSGGAGERADKMRDAPSLSALDKAAKGAAGSNRTGGHGEGKPEAGAPRVATPEEILSAALRLVEGVKKGEVALTSAALSYARRIATLVAADNGADFDD